ncbi:MAG: hypothetical protein Q9165_002208 [Trypethelium subeluteriae]
MILTDVRKQTQECDICQELADVEGRSWRIRRLTEAINRRRGLRSWEKQLDGSAIRRAVHYKERLEDLVKRYNYVTAWERNKAGPSAPRRRKRENEDEGQPSSSDEAPLPKHARVVSELDGYRRGDKALRRLERNKRYDQQAVYATRLQQLREQDSLEATTGRRVATGSEMGSLKRRHEEEEQEDDRPRKSRRLGESTATPTFIATLEGPVHRVSCLKGSITRSKANVARYAPDKRNGSVRSVRFDMDAQQEHRVKYEVRHRRRYKRPRQGSDGKMRGIFYQPGRWAARPGEELVDTSGLHKTADNFYWSPSESRAVVRYVGPEEVANYIRAREREQHAREAQRALKAVHWAWRKCVEVAGKLPWVDSFGQS